MWKKTQLLGDRPFYRRVVKITLPIVIQGGITNLVTLLDNVMVGQLGTARMSGVAIANQLLNIPFFGILGALSGIGIFTAQFFGKDDPKGLKYTFRCKVFTGILSLLFFMTVLFVFGDELIGLYIRFAGSEGSEAVARESALQYLILGTISLAPYVIGQVYATTLREINRTVSPMVASLAAVILNLILNYLFIFGKMGLPAMGVRGAGYATVISRVVEMLIMILWAAVRIPVPFRGFLRCGRMQPGFLKRVLARSAPLVLNEVLYCLSSAVIVWTISTRGLDAVAACNIATNVTQFFNVVLYSLGASLGILAGNLLGAGLFEEAKLTASRMIALAIAVCIFFGIVLIPVSIGFPRLFNTSDEVRKMAGQMIRVIAYMLPIRAFTHQAYYTLRAGGRTYLNLLFDGMYLTFVSAPICLALAVYTGIDPVALFAVSLASELSKAFLAAIWIKKGIWVRNVVSSDEANA